MSDGFLTFALYGERFGQIALRNRVSRRQTRRAFVLSNRLVQFAARLERGTQIVRRARDTRVQCDGHPIFLDGIVESANLLKGVSEAVMREKQIRLDADRLLKVRNRFPRPAEKRKRCAEIELSHRRRGIKAHGLCEFSDGVRTTALP